MACMQHLHPSLGPTHPSHQASMNSRAIRKLPSLCYLQVCRRSVDCQTPLWVHRLCPLQWRFAGSNTPWNIIWIFFHFSDHRIFAQSFGPHLFWYQKWHRRSLSITTLHQQSKVSLAEWQRKVRCLSELGLEHLWSPKLPTLRLLLWGSIRASWVAQYYQAYCF